MTQSNPIRVWSWRQAIIQSTSISSTTKHVLLTLSVYMNELGTGCYPSIDRLSSDTSLACKTVIGALNMAEINGFIQKKVHGFRGQQWARNEYFAAFPEERFHYGIIPQTKPSSDRTKHAARKALSNALDREELEKGECVVCGHSSTEAHHFDYDKPLEVFWLCRDHHQRITAKDRLSKKVVTVGNEQEKGGEPLSEGGDFNGQKVVTQSHTNYSLNSPINTPIDFEIFWDLYPRKTGKQSALRQYEKTSKRMRPQSLLNYLKAFVDAHNKAGTDKQFIMEASKWLYQERWNDDLSLIRARTSAQSSAKTSTEPPRRKFNPNDED